ncbi:MAG TPA: AAA family ATPase [bacterium]|nr:AAA family ATPase [bacterium]
MKLAVTGKGGVGKTTLAALIGRELRDRNYSVLMVDADPDANLAGALGVADAASIVPIAQMKELIEERTGAKAGTIGGFFKLNPTVDDLPAKLARAHEGIKLMVLGTVKSGGSGCICPESTLLKALLTHLFLNEKDAVILDMEAGLEHLGRGTAMGVDMMIVVVEPGKRSLETAAAIKKLARDLGIKKLGVVGSKVRGEDDRAFLENELQGYLLLGHVPFAESIRGADMRGESLLQIPPQDIGSVRAIVDRLEKEMKGE